MGSERRRWLAALLLAALFMALTYSCCRIVYETNDDSSIVAAASGAVTGTPYAGNGFTSYLYGALLALLFHAVPSIPWHAVLLLVLIWLSLSAVLKSCFTLCAARGIPAVLAVGMFAALYVGALLPYVTMLQFTTVPAMAASGACCLMLTAWENGKAHRFSLCMALVLLLMAWGMRIQSAWVAIPLLLLYAVTALLQKESGAKKICLFSIVGIILMAGLTLLDSKLYQWSDPNWVSFRDFDAQLGSLLDYNNTDLISHAADTLPEWTPWLTYMVRNWYQLDARVTADSLAALLMTAESISTPPSVLSVLKAAGSLLLRYPIFGFSLVGFGVWILWSCFRFWKQRQFVSALCLAASCLYLFVFAAYFYGYLGRMPMRAAFTAGCPFYVLALLGGLKAYQKCRKRDWAPVIVCVLALCVASPITAGNAFAPLRWVDQQQDHARRISEDVCAYVSAPENQGNIYASEWMLDLSPSYVHRDTLPSNLVPWTCGMFHSPLYQEKLQKLGYDSFTTENLMDDNVLLLITADKALNLLTQYLESEFGSVEALLVDETPSFGVYRLSWTENSSKNLEKSAFSY